METKHLLIKAAQYSLPQNYKELRGAEHVTVERGPEFVGAGRMQSSCKKGASYRSESR